MMTLQESRKCGMQGNGRKGVWWWWGECQDPLQRFRYSWQGWVVPSHCTARSPTCLAWPSCEATPIELLKLLLRKDIQVLAWGQGLLLSSKMQPQLLCDQLIPPMQLAFLWYCVWHVFSSIWHIHKMFKKNCIKSRKMLQKPPFCFFLWN